ncbi:MAG: hypothetical protein KAI79_13115 [Bacteroidales bacterium]|nr:hypothetical protein [Bacteroidales bacterium]
MSKIAFSGLTCFTVKTKMSRSKIVKDFPYLLLESNQSPCYYAKNNFPPTEITTNDHHLFLLVKNNVNCFQDIVLRHAAYINEKFGKNFHISPGQVLFRNHNYQAIRVNTADTKYLPQLVEESEKLGIKLLKKKKKIAPFDSIVFFKKYIEFVELGDGIYQDNHTKGRYFFRVPRVLEFDEFEQKIDKIKNNCDFHLFDSFLNHLFIGGKVQDFVGIYSEHCNEDRFEEFKKNLATLFE